MKKIMKKAPVMRRPVPQAPMQGPPQGPPPPGAGGPPPPMKKGGKLKAKAKTAKLKRGGKC